MDLDKRYADRVIGILAASIECADYGDLFGIGSGLLASLGAIGHQLPEGERALMARLMVASAKRLDGDVIGATLQ